MKTIKALLAQLLCLVMLGQQGWTSGTGDTLLVQSFTMGEEMIFGDIPTVVTATREEQSILSSPATMVVVTDEQIRQRGYTDLYEVFQDLPGFDISKDFSATYTNIFMRGFRSSNSERFILMYDGIVENDIWKQTNWVARQYPLSQVKRIEVLYGPASALYGTNAFGGIVNIITKSQDEVGRPKAAVSYGSWGTKTLDASVGKKVGERFGFNLTGRYVQQDELPNKNTRKLTFPGSFSSNYTGAYSQPKLFLDNRLTDISDLNEELPLSYWGLHGNLFFGNFKFTGLAWLKNDTDERRYINVKTRAKYAEWADMNQGYSLSHKLKISDNLALDSQAAYRYHQLLPSAWLSSKYYSANDSTANTTGIVNNDYNTYLQKLSSLSKGIGAAPYDRILAWDVNVDERVSYKPADMLNLSAGLVYNYTDTQEDYSEGNTKGNIMASPRHSRRRMGSYLQAIVQPADPLEVVVGARGERSRDENDRGYNVIVPRMAVVYKMAGNMSLRAQYSEAFQEADDWTKYSTAGLRVPNPTLKPEKLKSYEVGTMYATERMRVSAAVYTSKVSDVITLQPSGLPGLDQHRNTGEAKINGYELSLDRHLLKNIVLESNVSGAFNEDGNGTEIGDMAPVKLNLGVLYTVGKLSLYPKANYVSKKNTVNHAKNPATSPILRSIKGYTVVGLNANYRLGAKASLFAKFDNVFNSTYYHSGVRTADGVKYLPQIQQPKFNFMTGVTYTF
ncbi:MAG: TonB-dependent receptor [Elusimicrobia bacterium]|nr:TonB-dependent receptor [Elusimicrobiota bacterium]